MHIHDGVGGRQLDHAIPRASPQRDAGFSPQAGPLSVDHANLLSASYTPAAIQYSGVEGMGRVMHVTPSWGARSREMALLVAKGGAGAVRDLHRVGDRDGPRGSRLGGRGGSRPRGAG